LLFNEIEFDFDKKKNEFKIDRYIINVLHELSISNVYEFSIKKTCQHGFPTRTNPRELFTLVVKMNLLTLTLTNKQTKWLEIVIFLNSFVHSTLIFKLLFLRYSSRFDGWQAFSSSISLSLISGFGFF
jgi:hypothetical protein